MGELAIEWAPLDDVLKGMTTVGEQSAEFETYWNEHVCSTAGFDYPMCAIAPIGDAVKKLSPAFGDMRSVFDERWKSTVDAVIASAKAIDKTDQAVSLDYSKYLGQAGVPGTQVLPNVTVSYTPLNISDLALDPPGEGSDTQKHDPEWTTVSEGFDALRDKINQAVDKINSLGAGLKRLPEESLEHYIVYPLSGDYLAIQGNASACDTTGQQMGSWGNNFSKISVNAAVALRGQTSAALLAHLNVYNLVMKAVGKAIDAGSTVFTKIASVSEKIAVAVEKALVRMAKILLKVSTKVASRVLGFFGWVMLVKDFAEKGLAAITDIVDDVKRCIRIIDDCFALVEEIKAWAEQAAAQIKKLEELRDIVKELPGTSTGGLGQLPDVNVSVTGKKLDEITFGDPEKADSTSELDGSLNDLDASSSEAESESNSVDDGDDGDDDDEPVIMAPGPLYGEVPGYSSSSTGGMTV